MRDSALNNIRVIDLTRVISGPHCTMILGDLGAEIIKIEKPGTGDISREYSPFYQGHSTYFMTHNRNKKSITLNFRHPDALDIIYRLISDADILVENFKAGTLEKMGLAPEKLLEMNPRLIITRISGFGQDGPYSSLPCFDAVAQSLTGLMDMTGFPDAPPVMMGSYVCDFSAGLYGVIGTLAALHSREQTGKGQVVDVSLLDCACSLTHSAIMNYFMLNEVTTRNGNQDRAAWPASFYPTKDHKLIYIHAGQDPAFAAFCHISGNESYAEDPEYMHLNGRKNHIRVCDQLVSEWTCNHTLNEIMSMCRENNIPCAPVNTVKEMVSDPQLLHRNMICDMYDNNLGTIKTTGPVLKMSETPPKIQYSAPEIGEHNYEIYHDRLGYSEQELAMLKATGVI